MTKEKFKEYIENKINFLYNLCEDSREFNIYAEFEENTYNISATIFIIDKFKKYFLYYKRLINEIEYGSMQNSFIEYIDNGYTINYVSDLIDTNVLDLFKMYYSLEKGSFYPDNNIYSYYKYRLLQDTTIEIENENKEGYSWCEIDKNNREFCKDLAMKEIYNTKDIKLSLIHI